MAQTQMIWSFACQWIWQKIQIVYATVENHRIQSEADMQTVLIKCVPELEIIKSLGNSTVHLKPSHFMNTQDLS
jgi:uncharacterized protein YlxP (DUF503 family)